MKPAKKIITLTLLSVALYQAAINQAHAGGGSGGGVRGGGHVVEVGGKKELLDLVTTYVCKVKTAESMLAENPYFEKILQKISYVDWYFAEDIKRALLELEFCMTQQLYRLMPKFDPVINKTVVMPDPLLKIAKNGAIRVGNKVYWDTQITKDLSDRSRAFLLLHEVMHSYLDWSLSDEERYLNLYSMIQVISDLEKSGISDEDPIMAADFHLQMRQNVLFPTTPENLEPYREKLNFLLWSNTDQQVATILQIAEPETLVDITIDEDKPIYGSLANWDAHTYSVRTSSMWFLESLLSTAMRRSTPEQFKDLLSVKTYKKINPLMIALSIPKKKIGSEKQSIIESSTLYAKLFDDVYSSIQNAQVRQTENKLRIMANSNLIALSATNQKISELAVTSLVPFDQQKNKISELTLELQGFARLIASLIKEEKWHVIESKITANNLFYNSFGLKNVKSTIMPMNTKIEREKELALRIVSECQQGLLGLFLHAIEVQISRDEYQKFVSKIDFNKFN